MKRIILFFFFVISFSSFSQDPRDTTGEARTKFLYNKAIGQELRPQLAKELEQLTYAIQNRGFIFDERFHDYQSALAQTNRALEIWIAMEDPVNEANMRKYKGYLLGHLGRFEEAKNEINTAIHLYTTAKKDFGVVVSQFDLSRVYEMEGKMDTALYFANISLSYWKAAGNSFRVIAINSQLMNLYLKLNELDKAESIQKESEKMTNDQAMHWQALIDFYYLSNQLYTRLKNNVRAEEFKTLYKDRIAQLKSENITALSAYETR